MNDAMLQLLATRLNMTPEEVGAVRNGDASVLIANRIRDPGLAAAMTAMLRPAAESADESADDTTPESRAEERLQAAQREIERLQRDLAAADTMIRYVADVLGACQLCWGRSPSCARCRGRGTPGSRVPLEEELLAWVGPALQRLHMRVVRGSP